MTRGLNRALLGARLIRYGTSVCCSLARDAATGRQPVDDHRLVPHLRCSRRGGKAVAPQQSKSISAVNNLAGRQLQVRRRRLS